MRITKALPTSINLTIYTIATLPTATTARNGEIALISNGTNGYELVACNGSTWLRFAPSASIGGNNLLNTYPASAHIGLTRQNSSYAGSHLRVRRSSDNAETNLSFAGDLLDTTSLLNFVGSGNGFIRTAFDDSGNGRNFEETDTTRQPQIVEGGQVILNNGKPAMRFSRASKTRLRWQGGNTTVGSTVLVSSCTDTTFPDENGLLSDLTGLVGWGGAGSQVNFNNYHNDSHHINNVATRAYLPATSSELLFSRQTSGNTTWNGVNVGNDRGIDTTRNWDGTVSEIFLFTSDQLANRVDIQNRLNTYYNCY
jgi:hypothetical protein